VEQTEQGEPEQAAHLQHDTVGPARLFPLKVQEQAGPEQHREQGAHLSFENDQAQHECPVVGRTARTGQSRRIGRRARLGETGDVDRQNAHDGKTANQV